MGRPTRSDVDDLEITIRKRNAVCSFRLLQALHLNHGSGELIEAEPEAVQEPVEAPALPPVALIEPAPAPPFRARPLWFGIVSGDDDLPSPPKIHDIRRAACKYFKLSSTEICSARRPANITYPRQIAYYVCKSLTTKSLPEIGRQFGGKDHTTVLHGVRKIERLMQTSWIVAYDVAHVEASIETAY